MVFILGILIVISEMIFGVIGALVAFFIYRHITSSSLNNQIYKSNRIDSAHFNQMLAIRLIEEREKNGKKI